MLQHLEPARPILTSRPRQSLRRRTLVFVLFGVAAFVDFACASNDEIIVPPTVELKTIAIDSGARVIELGTLDTLSVTAVDVRNDTVSIPVVWRSSNEKVATFVRGGVFVARDTGTTIVIASSLGVASAPTAFAVVWNGPAAIDTLPFTPPSALNPGTTLTDSVRVRVTNIRNAPVANARVAFAVTGGGGSVSPATATTNALGIAAAQWTIGPGVGTNTMTASVVHADGSPDTLVKKNAAVFTITGYNALTIASGDGQTAQILSDVPTNPSVKLVDSTGAPRPGVPITFTVSNSGRLGSAVASTNASGVASPGKWTLGDIPGDQTLEAKVSDARVVLHATGTGTPIHYKPSSVTAGPFATCAVEADGSVKCWGQTPANGGDTTNVSSPIPVKGSLVATTITSSATHFCTVNPSKEVWCWGTNALMDTSGQTVSTSHPVKLPSTLSWASVSPGTSHNCALTVTQEAYCWGGNGVGQLGDLTTTTHFKPTAVSGGFSFTQIASGQNHTCALASSGAAFCWGGNSAGELGDGTTNQHNGPTAVGGGLTFQSIGTGSLWSCGLATDGKAYCWGRVAGTVRTTPTTFTNGPTFTSITVGSTHACGLTASGDAYCWGENSYGQLGDSSTNVRVIPTAVAGGLKFTQLNAGVLHTCGLTSDGSVVCWGRNDAGELAETPPTIRTVPKYVVLGVTP